MLIPLRDREVGLELRSLASTLGISPDQIVLTQDGYAVPPNLALAYGWTGLTPTPTQFTVNPAPRAVLPPSKVGPVCFTKPGVVDLCVYRGDSGRVRVRVTDADGLPVDVSAATWDCDFRTTEDTAAVLCSPDIEPVVGVTNAVDVVLTSEMSSALSADCVWDLEMTLGPDTTTLLAGKVLVTKDVSRT